jgi:hypothetical protein
MRARDDFLTGVATFIEADGVQQVQVQHVGRELLRLLTADIGDTRLDQVGDIDITAVRRDVKIDFTMSVGTASS